MRFIRFYPQFTLFFHPLAHLTLAHHAGNVPLRNLRRLIDSTIFQETRSVTDKGGETWRSSAELRFEDRKNVGTLPRFVTTPQTRIINPRNMVPCSLYLPVITIFFMSYLSSPTFPRSRRNAPSPLSASFAYAFEHRVTTRKEHLRSAIRCSHTRSVNRRIYVYFGTRYLPVVSNRFAASPAGGGEYRDEDIGDSIKTGNYAGFRLYDPTCLRGFAFTWLRYKRVVFLFSV